VGGGTVHMAAPGSLLRVRQTENGGPKTYDSTP